MIISRKNELLKNSERRKHHKDHFDVPSAVKMEFTPPKSRSPSAKKPKLSPHRF
jgi:hypothetical protein